MKELLAETAVRAARYVAAIGDRKVSPNAEQIARLDALGGPLPENPCAPGEVLALLDDLGSPATVATSGGRYFGFVIGGTLPAALAANWLASAWDQNAAMQVMSPVAAKVEDIVSQWTLDLLGTCLRPAVSASSPAPRWRTSQAWPQRARPCFSGSAGMSKKTACSELLRFASSSARKFTSPCSKHSTCWASAAPA